MGQIVIQYTKEQLIEVLDDILEMGDSTEFDFLIGMAAQGASRSELVLDYINTLTKWYFYLKAYVEAEEYEMADKINKVILIEELHILNIMKQFCTWFTKDDKILVKSLGKEMRVLYGL